MHLCPVYGDGVIGTSPKVFTPPEIRVFPIENVAEWFIKGLALYRVAHNAQEGK